jgi:hypothetical protein
MFNVINNFTTEIKQEHKQEFRSSAYLLLCLTPSYQLRKLLAANRRETASDKSGRIWTEKIVMYFTEVLIFKHMCVEKLRIITKIHSKQTTFGSIIKPGIVLY